MAKKQSTQKKKANAEKNVKITLKRNNLRLAHGYEVVVRKRKK